MGMISKYPRRDATFRLGKRRRKKNHTDIKMIKAAPST
jgi:hypothetical protein